MNCEMKIKIQGRLDKNWEDWLEGMEIIHEGDYTILRGTPKDQAFMHGILNLIRDLNLKLISLNPTEVINNKY